MSAATQTILKNQNLIAINQDSLGLQATQVVQRRHAARPGQAAGQRRRRGRAVQPGQLDRRRSRTTAAAIGKTGSSFTLRDAWTNATSATTGAITAERARRTAPWCTGSAAAAPHRRRQHHTLVSAASGRCLDVPNEQHRQRHPAGHLGLQRRRPTSAGRSAARPSRRSASASTRRSTPPPAPRSQLWDCNGGTNQQWTFNADGTISGVASGLCLDVTTTSPRTARVSVCGPAPAPSTSAGRASRAGSPAGTAVRGG